MDVIFFEELIENPMEVIVDLLNKLGIHIEEERKKCFIKHLGGRNIILLKVCIGPIPWVTSDGGNIGQ